MFNNLGKNKGKSRQCNSFKKRLFDMFVQQIIAMYYRVYHIEMDETKEL